MTQHANETAHRHADIRRLAEDAAEAAAVTSLLRADTKTAVLNALADAIDAATDRLLAANQRDIASATAAGLESSKLARLTLTAESLVQLTAGVRQIASMPDPVNRVVRQWTTESGLNVRKQQTPLGVIAMIYEARPGVTIDAFALCFKAGNACILKGGREAAESNAALAVIANDVLRAHGVPPAALSLFTSSDRDELREMLTLSGSIDLVIPRGGEALIRFVHEHSRIPTIQHFRGVCHVYVDRDADLDKALNIVATGKTSAPATCNSTECVLVHEAVADRFVPALAERAGRDGFVIHADAAFQKLAQDAPSVVAAANDDWGREFLDTILAARVVASIDEAIDHITDFASDHTEAIITENKQTADRFTSDITSSCVLVNASTRFNDGFQLGLGAEIGISTTKLHAYGPMGLDELTTQRFVVIGNGQTR